MINETPVNYTERFQREIAETLKVNVDARAQRIQIEDSLKMDPFIEHLYSEGEFEKLIFFEQRRTNDLLMQLIDVMSGAHKSTENPVCEIGHPTIPVKDDVPIKVAPQSPDEILGELLPTAPGVVPEDDEDKPAYAYASNEPMDPETGIHQVDADSLSPAEAASIKPTKAANKRPVVKGRR